MKYFYIFILTLILISCNEKKGYSFIDVELGREETNISEKECVKVLQKGNVIYQSTDSLFGDFDFSRMIYKDYLYYIIFKNKSFVFHCSHKRRLPK